MDMNEVDQELEAIGKLLDTALEFGLELEVIYGALNQMKSNPNLKPIEAFALAVTDWIK